VNEDQLKKKFMNDFMNNINLSQIMRILAIEAERYADDKVKNPKKPDFNKKQEVKVSWMEKIKNKLGLNKKQTIPTKKLTSKRG
jgi:hypothetical protein